MVFGVADITTPRKIIDRLRKAYCSGFGVEFMNINDPEKEKWLQRRMKPFKMNSNQQPMIACMPFVISPIQRLPNNPTSSLPGTKRFSLEGAESLIPLLALILDKSAEMGAQRCMVGMAHRGRLNVLAKYLTNPFVIFS